MSARGNGNKCENVKGAWWIQANTVATDVRHDWKQTQDEQGLDSLNLPKHRAVEIQTSDAGLGVSTKENLAQIRLAEAFQVHNLDLQGRLHYSPGDSRVHIAEKVMRSLNEHAGVGHTIPIPSVPLTSLVLTGELMAMSKNEMKDL